MQGVQIWPLVRELRFLMPHSKARGKKKTKTKRYKGKLQWVCHCHAPVLREGRLEAVPTSLPQPPARSLVSGHILVTQDSFCDLSPFLFSSTEPTGQINRPATQACTNSRGFRSQPSSWYKGNQWRAGNGLCFPSSGSPTQSARRPDTLGWGPHTEFRCRSVCRPPRFFLLRDSLETALGTCKGLRIWYKAQHSAS